MKDGQILMANNSGLFFIDASSNLSYYQTKKYQVQVMGNYCLNLYKNNPWVFLKNKKVKSLEKKNYELSIL